MLIRLSKKRNPAGAISGATVPLTGFTVCRRRSCAMGAAWEIIEMPALVFKKRIAHKAYHCHVLSQAAGLGRVVR